jgi:tRNA (cmo5U34)-methyltransferase
MLDQAGALIAQSGLDKVIELSCADINDVLITNASIVVMNFTLQFIQPEQRLKLLEKIYQGMNPNGILILSEKLSFTREEQQQLLIDMHHFFKKANGYSALEISQKRQSLENVLIPETLDQHQQRLLAAGFKQAEQWFQCFNFVSMVAVK